MPFDLISELESKNSLITVPEVADMFSISIRTVNRMVTERKIPSFLIGGQRRFDPAQILRWVLKRNPKMLEGRTA